MRTRNLDDRPQEFPRVNEALVSRRHRYGYSTAASEMSRACQAVDGTPPRRGLRQRAHHQARPAARDLAGAPGARGRGGERGRVRAVRPVRRPGGGGRRDMRSRTCTTVTAGRRTW
ncbi:hypothetical protein [Streptomyces sp. AK010]|uniref:hypothetical protein n=1 Tax=Streptomyces sp. AK010 TaxID=2723074 RepID=UPI0037DA6240